MQLSASSVCACLDLRLIVIDWFNIDLRWSDTAGKLDIIHIPHSSVTYVRTANSLVTSGMTRILSRLEKQTEYLSKFNPTRTPVDISSLIHVK